MLRTWTYRLQPESQHTFPIRSVEDCAALQQPFGQYARSDCQRTTTEPAKHKQLYPTDVSRRMGMPKGAFE
jgi:hypothetical protein